jgi:hypothetical protein
LPRGANFSAIVRQMGWDPKVYAADLIEREDGPENCVPPFTPAIDVDGGYYGKGGDHPVGRCYAVILSRIIVTGLAAISKEMIAPSSWNCRVGSPDTATGRRPVLDRLRASFPSASFEINHQMGRDDTEFAPRAAIRWSLTGKHEGWGTFGAPTGAEVHVMVISHAEFGPGVGGENMC